MVIFDSVAKLLFFPRYKYGYSSAIFGCADGETREEVGMQNQVNSTM